MTATKQTPCFCQSFEFGEFDGENEAAVSYDTNCSQSTTRVFAQGHDAKLAGYLVRAELSGEEIRMTEGGMAVSSDALGMARKVSEAFEAKVQAMLDAAKARLAKKELAEARKAARKSAKKAAAAEPVVELAPIEARIKVGRWTYDAQIDRTTREATYSAKLGGTKTAADGTYTVL
jgi:Xaa-Pro aminopeptidase